MRQKFLVTILSGFVSGVFVSSFIDFGWAFALLFIFLGLVFGIINYRHRTSIIAALFFVAVGFGQLKYGQSDLNGRQSDLRNKTEQRMSLVGIVSEEPEQKENYNRLGLKDEENEGKILVFLQNYPQYKYGDKLKINRILKNPERFTGKIQDDRRGSHSSLVRIQHHHCGGNDNAVFQFFAPILGHRRGSNRRCFICHNDRSFGYRSARFHYGSAGFDRQSDGQDLHCFLGAVSGRFLYGFAKSENFTV